MLLIGQLKYINVQLFIGVLLSGVVFAFIGLCNVWTAIHQLKWEFLPGFSNREAFTPNVENQRYLQLIQPSQTLSFSASEQRAKSVRGICCLGCWCCTAAMLALGPLLCSPLPGTTKGKWRCRYIATGVILSAVFFFFFKCPSAVRS